MIVDRVFGIDLADNRQGGGTWSGRCRHADGRSLSAGSQPSLRCLEGDLANHNADRTRLAAKRVQPSLPWPDGRIGSGGMSLREKARATAARISFTES